MEIDEKIKKKIDAYYGEKRVFVPISIPEFEKKIKDAIISNNHYKKKNIDCSEPFNIITDYYHVTFRGITEQLLSDLNLIHFDSEFQRVVSQGDEDCVYGIDLIGSHTLDNELTFMGVEACGGGEFCVYFVLYWDGKNIRGYLPYRGNVWNRLNLMAFGNNEDSDIKSLQERLKENKSNISLDLEDPFFNINHILIDLIRKDEILKELFEKFTKKRES